MTLQQAYLHQILIDAVTLINNENQFTPQWLAIGTWGQSVHPTSSIAVAYDFEGATQAVAYICQMSNRAIFKENDFNYADLADKTCKATRAYLNKVYNDNRTLSMYCQMLTHSELLSKLVQALEEIDFGSIE